MDAMKEAANKKLMEEAEEKLKEGAGPMGCFVSCLGVKGFMKTCGACCLKADVRDTVNELLDKIDD
eukprot:CAMPEP_0185724366 /NCGR_PEP_ID=MMETSP1171-20130828/872_1 /TAXON_ID=374046 /ORGANISM="Helicotheca tamensis, Strain CCMP826" /LENGTH=65 /DNA_ID=CAMNT_0028392199 /DNA_START=91 /DNA_END=288 /DNA_ORIENTATION=-